MTFGTLHQNYHLVYQRGQTTDPYVLHLFLRKVTLSGHEGGRRLVEARVRNLMNKLWLICAKLRSSYASQPCHFYSHPNYSCALNLETTTLIYPNNQISSSAYIYIEVGRLSV